LDIICPAYRVFGSCRRTIIIYKKKDAKIMIKQAILFLALVFLISPFASAKQPNILLILSDDHGITDSGAYGNTVIKTPNIDSLAAEGMRFTSAFATEAICAPSRQSVYTGLYPMHHGGHRNHTEVKADTLSLPHYFMPLGYQVYMAGKKHYGPAEAFPFIDLKKSENTYSDSDSLISGYFKAMEKIFNHNDQPFFIMAATSLPHTLFGLKEGYPEPTNYQPKEIPIPPYLVDTLETRTQRAGYYELVSQLDTEIGTLLTILNNSKAKENTIVIYASDHGAGFAFEKWTNYDAGIRVPLIVKWPNNIIANSQSDALVSLIDLLPTLLEAADGEAPSTIDGQSFLPVLKGNSSSHRELIFATHTTLGIRNASDASPIRTVRSERFKYIRNLNPSGIFTNNVTEKGQGGWFSWQKKAGNDLFAKQRVQLYQHRPAEEFYDLLNDPYELNNLAGQAPYKEQQDYLNKALDNWMVEQNDLGLDAPVTPKNLPWWQTILAMLFFAAQWLAGLFS
jgi:N-sulfoglucosamine sulfohydrolase